MVFFSIADIVYYNTFYTNITYRDFDRVVSNLFLYYKQYVIFEYHLDSPNV